MKNESAKIATEMGWTDSTEAADELLIVVEDRYGMTREAAKALILAAADTIRTAEAV